MPVSGSVDRAKSPGKKGQSWAKVPRHVPNLLVNESLHSKGHRGCARNGERSP